MIHTHLYVLTLYQLLCTYFGTDTRLHVHVDVRIATSSFCVLDWSICWLSNKFGCRGDGKGARRKEVVPEQQHSVPLRLSHPVWEIPSLLCQTVCSGLWYKWQDKTIGELEKTSLFPMTINPVPVRIVWETHWPASDHCDWAFCVSIVSTQRTLTILLRFSQWTLSACTC